MFENPDPSFEPYKVFGRKAKRVLLSGNGETRYAYNIISRPLVEDRIAAFGQRVLNPILRGTDATLVPILNGAMTFGTELGQHISEGSTVQVMAVQARSYGTGETPGPVIIASDHIVPEKVRGRTVVVLDDVLESGATVAAVVRELEIHKPARIITVFLLRKMLPKGPLLEPDFW